MNAATGIGTSKKGKHVEPARYTCDNCGVQFSAGDAVPACIGCGKMLCEICNNYMLCPHDFQLLNEKDKKKVKRLGVALQNIHDTKGMFTFMPLGLAIAGGVLLVLMIFLQGEIFYIIFSFLGGFLLLGAIMMHFTFHGLEGKERARTALKVRDIVMSYNIPRFQHGTLVHENEKKAGIIQDKLGIMVCKYCGAEIQARDIVYCEICGSKLT